MSIELEKITLTIRQVRTVEVEISAETGYCMPDSVVELVEMCNEVRDYPMNFIPNGDTPWEVENIESVDVEYNGEKA